MDTSKIESMLNAFLELDTPRLRFEADKRVAWLARYGHNDARATALTMREVAAAYLVLADRTDLIGQIPTVSPAAAARCERLKKHLARIEDEFNAVLHAED